MPQRSLLGWELGPLPASSPRLTLWGPPVGDGLMGGRGTGAGTPRGARLGPLDSQSVLSAQPRTVSGPSPRSTPRTRPPAPGAGAHSAVSPHIHVLDSYAPRARGGGQAPRHILYVPCPGGGISVLTFYTRKPEPGGGEACSRSLSQGVVKRGPDVRRVSHKSLQTRFLQLPATSVLAPTRKPLPLPSVTSGVLRGGGRAAPLRTGLRHEPREWRTRRAVWTLLGALAAGSRLRSISSWAGGCRGSTEAWLTPSPCLMRGGGSQAQRGRHTAPGHTAARPSWASAQ